MISREDHKDVKKAFGGKIAKAVARATDDGFDSKKRWGNSAMKGHGVNSPAMMEARASNDAKNKAIHAKTIGSSSKKDKFKIVRRPGYRYSLEPNVKKHHDDLMKYETN